MINAQLPTPKAPLYGISYILQSLAACTFFIQALSLYHQVICVNTFAVVQNKLDSDWLF